MKKILVVDDNLLNLQLLGKLLSENGYHVLVAKSVSQALAIANTKHPDLIVTDIMMPEIDGIELCNILQSNPPTSKIPLIFVSATTDREIISMAAKAGGVDFLSKPFNASQLLHLVGKHSGNEESHQESERNESAAGRTFDKKTLKDTTLLDTLAADNPGIKEYAVKDFQSVAVNVEKKLGQIVNNQISSSEVLPDLHRLTNLCPYVANKSVIEEIRHFEALLRTTKGVSTQNYTRFISLIRSLDEELQK
jgi:CheY-like chemotaxis protein